jgi:3D (Asp-Asp-Asp) domain-containing protein
MMGSGRRRLSLGLSAALAGGALVAAAATMPGPALARAAGRARHTQVALGPFTLVGAEPGSVSREARTAAGSDQSLRAWRAAGSRAVPRLDRRSVVAGDVRVVARVRRARRLARGVVGRAAARLGGAAAGGWRHASRAHRQEAWRAPRAPARRLGSWVVARTLWVTSTAYWPNPAWSNGYTATGIRARYGVVAVDPSVIPLGSHLYVPGYGPALAADTGGAIVGDRIDVCFDSADAAVQWGVRQVRILVLKRG